MNLLKHSKQIFPFYIRKRIESFRQDFRNGSKINIYTEIVSEKK